MFLCLLDLWYLFIFHCWERAINHTDPFIQPFGTPLHHVAAVAAVTLSPPFPRIVLLKLSLLSTSTVGGNERPTCYPKAENMCPMSHFLLNECGMFQYELSIVLKQRPSCGRTRSTHTAQQAVQCLRYSGFTEDQVRKIITKNAYILTLNVDRQLKPKFEFIKRWVSLQMPFSAYIDCLAAV